VARLPQPPSLDELAALGVSPSRDEIGGTSSNERLPRSHGSRRTRQPFRNAGIRVTLLWATDTSVVAVLVHDDGTDDEFESLVEPDANPIDVYEHPYAHAAWRGIDYRLASLPHAA
jgi:hypothetical protein